MATFNENLRINGTLSPRNMDIANTSIGDEQCTEIDPLQCPSQYHQYVITIPLIGSFASYLYPIHQAFSSGELIDAFVTSSGTDPLNADFTIRKNGSADITTTAASMVSPATPYDAQHVVLDTDFTEYVQGDVFEMDVNVIGGIGSPDSLLFTAIFREEAG
jgi:hypothetical protein